MIRKFILLAVLFSISNVSAKENKLEEQETKVEISNSRLIPLVGFADIIEPLMPSVVNVYTITYPKRTYIRRKGMNSFFPYEQFNSFFEQFNVPFSFEEIYSHPQAMSLGSGFVVNESGLIVTNYHVVADSDEVSVKFSDNVELPARIIGLDPKTDLAVIKVETNKKLVPVKFGDSSLARVGDVVIAIGNPLGFGGTVTTGIISSKGRDLGPEIDGLVDDFIQTDAAINSGNSGGPLFNTEGEVIGVNSAVPAAGGGTSIGIGFAIPSNTVKEIIQKLEKEGKVSRGRLDIATQEVTPELSEALSLKYNYGAIVVDVRPGGAGDKAGIIRGDLIIEFNGNKVQNARKLQLFVAESNVGTKAKIIVVRDGKEIELSADIIEIDGSNSQKREENFKPKELAQIGGILVIEVPGALIANLGLDEDFSGVLVAKIDEQLSETELRVNDIIISADQRKIDGIQSFKEIYESIKNEGRKNIVLLIRRNDITLFAILPIIN